LKTKYVKGASQRKWSSILYWYIADRAYIHIGGWKCEKLASHCCPFVYTSNLFEKKKGKEVFKNLSHSGQICIDGWISDTEMLVNSKNQVSLLPPTPSVLSLSPNKYLIMENKDYISVCCFEEVRRPLLPLRLHFKFNWEK